jgi:hypothetical protein
VLLGDELLDAAVDLVVVHGRIRYSPRAAQVRVLACGLPSFQPLSWAMGSGVIGSMHHFG